MILMTAFITALLLALSPPQGLAAKRLAQPECSYSSDVTCLDGIDNDHDGTVDESAPSAAFSAVTGGYAASVENCNLVTYATFTDTESSSGTAVKKATGAYFEGAIGCPFDAITADTYYVWAKVRLATTTLIRERIAFLNNSPFSPGFQTSRSFLVSDVVLPPPPSFGWVTVGDGFDTTTLAHANDQTTLALSATGALYIMSTRFIEWDCIYISTSSTATPICPEGAPVTGIAHDVTGTGDSGEAQSDLTVTYTVGAGSNRVCVCGICHRTSTDTISSVVSDVDGAYTLLDWAQNGATTVAQGLWYNVAPTTGAHTVTVTFSEAQNGVANCSCYTGVHQTTPFTAVSTFEGSANPSYSIASGTDFLALDHLCASVDTAETVTADGAQTQRWQENAGATGGANRIGASSTKQGDASVQFDWTISGSKVWTAQAFSLRSPASGGGAPTVGSPSVTSLGSTTVTVQASTSDTSDCYAQYDTDTGTPYASETTPAVASVGGVCTVQITGLTAGTPYFYRIRANNGSDGFSSEGTFMTSSGSVNALGWRQEEIDVWAQRALNGPYKSSGDVSTNSPGDWTRIVTNKNTFNSSPSADRWSGNTAGTCWSYPANAPIPGRYDGTPIHDAAFFWLVDKENNPEDTTTKNNVITELIAQAGVSGVDFSNGSIWCTGFSSDAAIFEVAHWGIRMLVAYGIVRGEMTGPQQTTMDTWFTNMATFFEDRAANAIETGFPNRDAESLPYATYGAGYSAADCHGGGTAKILYFGGPEKDDLHGLWNNRRSAFAALYGLTGIVVNSTTLKNAAKKFFQEWMTYAVFYDGGNPIDEDFHRWTTNSPTLGWGYGGGNIAPRCILADTFARTGDDSLYTYSTSDGTCPGNQATGGGSKTLEGVIETYMKFVNGDFTRYGTDQSGNQTAAYVIGPDDQISGASRVFDTYMTPCNLYFNNSLIKSSYLRSDPDAPAYPSSPQTGGTEPWGGVGGYFPGILFMFGNMEGVVSPYD